jgi:hypothetical protein
MLTISCQLAAGSVTTIVITFAAVMLPVDHPNDCAVRPIPEAQLTW